MACLVCKRDRPILARGLCNSCYGRWQRTGSLEYKIRARSTCSVGGCTDTVVSHGLCDKHRQRLRKHGHIEETRIDTWGARSRHPLGNAWKHLLRKRSEDQIAPEWRGDFLQFITDVGEKPSPSHKLFAADETRPIGPSNFVWKMAVTQRVEGEDERTYENRRMRSYRKLRTEEFKGYDLKKHYGLTTEEHGQMHKRRDGKCSICGEPETTVILGRLICLSVDHDHKTGKVRDLLCKQCNHGLGNFKDSPTLLRAAAAYLEAHAMAPVSTETVAVSDVRVAAEADGAAISWTETPIAPLSLPG